MYYIVGKTEYGDTLFWSGIDWEVSIGYAQQYGALEGSFEVGKLQAEYIDSYNPSTYKGMRIVRIYTI